MTELKAFAVSWESRGRGGNHSGARRVYATDEKDAALRGSDLIERDLLLPRGSVHVFEVTPIERS